MTTGSLKYGESCTLGKSLATRVSGFSLGHASWYDREAGCPCLLSTTFSVLQLFAKLNYNTNYTTDDLSTKLKNGLSYCNSKECDKSYTLYTRSHWWHCLTMPFDFILTPPPAELKQLLTSVNFFMQISFLIINVQLIKHLNKTCVHKSVAFGRISARKIRNSGLETLISVKTSGKHNFGPCNRLVDILGFHYSYANWPCLLTERFYHMDMIFGRSCMFRVIQGPFF